MGQKKHPFHLTLSGKATAGSNDVAMEQVEDGRLYAVQRTSFENETTAFTDARVLVGGVGGEHVVAEQNSPEAATVYSLDDDIFVTEGQYVLVRFTGCTLNDVLKVYLSGWWQQARELDGTGGGADE